MTSQTTDRRQFERWCNASTHAYAIDDALSLSMTSALLPWLSGPYRSARERSGVVEPLGAVDELEQLTRAYRRRPTTELLELLNSDYGIAWNDVASVAGISRQAVRKWRNGQALPDNRRFGSLCKLAAFANLVQCRGGDPGHWLRTPLQLSDEIESHLSVADVLSTGNFGLALRHYNRGISDGDILARVFPSYRAKSDGLAKIELGDGVFVISLDQLGLLTEDSDVDEAQGDLLSQVRDYIVDWYEFLRYEDPHKTREELVTRLKQADRNSMLAEILFGG
ncbi:hypothetical protein [Candidatus Poriferisodalis sp.]|uniref:hypothetical protein n=1 Tax=Candidatus Poriferisodalis sp. TaxID=3101277 RepID=UPI003B51FACB